MMHTKPLPETAFPACACALPWSAGVHFIPFVTCLYIKAQMRQLISRMRWRDIEGAQGMFYKFPDAIAGHLCV